jgi:hypothetical protein
VLTSGAREIKRSFCRQIYFRLCLPFTHHCVFQAGCSRTVNPEIRYVPAGDLLDIVKEFQRQAREDTYRFPIPKDVTGANIMKATLVRLDDYEKKNPGKFTDIIQFNKALALERLREYQQAAALYRKVAETEGRLGKEASKNAEILDTFLLILDRPLASDDPFEYIKGLDEKVIVWNQLISKHQGTAYEFLARVEKNESIALRSPSSRPTIPPQRRQPVAILGYTQLSTKHRK